MHAYYRMIHDGHEPAGDFCPLDLYSGDELRVTRAVLALWDGWVNSKGSANNLRVFVSGETIHPENVCQIRLVIENDTHRSHDRMIPSNVLLR